MSNTLKFGNGEWYGKKDTILAYNDLNSNFKPLAFNFDRASSATVVNKAGLIETVGSGEPRIDYKDDSKGALKLEPSRTNSVPYSQEFSNSDWNKNSSGIDTSIGNNGINENIAISPDGTLNADRVNFLLQSDLDVGIGKSISSSSGTTWSASVWIKGEGSNIGKNIGFRLKRSSGGSYVGNDGTIELTSEWVRIEINPLTLIANNNGVRLILSSNDATSCLIYGAQIEQGSYATSIIPTSGGVVTRVQDSCTNGGNEQVFNGSDGAIFLNFASYGDYVISLDNAAATNRIQFFRTTTNDRIYIMIGGTFIINEVYRGTSNGVYNKYALSYESGNILLYVNGLLLRTYTTPFTSTPFTKFRLNQYDNNASVSLSLIDSKIYNTALTDQELINLTTI